MTPGRSSLFREPPAWLGTLLIVALLALAYAPVWNAGYVWDDHDHLVDNRLVQDPRGWARIWTTVGDTPQYYPLTFTAFWLQHRLWGLDPRGYHAVNVALMGVTAILLWRLFRRLGSPVAWWGACLFALHPANVMSVAWVTELKNVLSGSLAVAAVLAYAPVLEKPGPASARRLAAVFLLYLLAMTAKTASSFVPVSLLLLNLWRKRRPPLREWITVAAMLALAGLFAVITIRWETMTKWAVMQDFSVSWAERWAVFGAAFWFYLGKALLPVNLMFFYPRWDLAEPVAWWVRLLPLSALAALAAAWVLRRRIGHGPAATLLHYTLTTSALILVHVLYMTRYTWVTDHWQFYGLLGLVPAAAWGLYTLLQPRLGARTLAIIASTVLILYGLGARRATLGYHDAETFYRTALAGNPNAWLAHNNLAHLLQSQGRRAEAEVHYLTALRLRPDNAEAVNNYGSLLYEFGRVAEAEAHFREALRLQPNLPGLDNNLGLLLARSGRLREAEKAYLGGTERRPRDAASWLGLGLVRAEQGNLKGATEAFRRRVALSPRDPDSHLYLARALTDLGQHREALIHYRTSLELRPNQPEAANAAAWLLATSYDPAVRDGTEAVRLARLASAAQPQRPPFRGTLAAALAEAGRFDEAVAAADQAMQLARTVTNAAFVAVTETRRARFAAGQPWREPPPNAR